MMDRLNQQEVEAKRTEYLNGLYVQAIGGNVDAGEELSKIAMGGFQLARDLVRRMDENLVAPVIRSASDLTKEGTL